MSSRVYTVRNTVRNTVRVSCIPASQYIVLAFARSCCHARHTGKNLLACTKYSHFFCLHLLRHTTEVGGTGVCKGSLVGVPHCHREAPATFCSRSLQSL